MIELAIWIGVAIAALAAVWATDPYHRRIIDSRPKVGIDSDDGSPRA